MQKLLKLQHHRHTGRRLAHHHTSYRGLAAVLLACGLAMFMIQKASADSYIVTAKVPVDIPTTASEITAPLSGGIYTNPNVNISGTCQVVAPASIVSLWIGSSMIGSSACGAGGTYSILVTLPAGTSNIVPKTSTILNDSGPDGAVWVATYNPPYVPPINPPTPSSGDNTPPTGTGIVSENGPALSTSKAFLVYTANKPATLVVIIARSSNPYKLETDWGDGTIERSVFKEAGRHELQHIYKRTGSFKMYLNLEDGKGTITHFVLAVESLNGTGANLVARINPLPTIGSTDSSWLKMVWLGYLCGVVLVVGLWLTQKYGHSGALGRDFVFIKHKRTSRSSTNNLSKKRIRDEYRR